MSPHDRGSRAVSVAGTVGTMVAAALIPKCPLCVAAALSAIGIGTTLGSSIAPTVRPFGFALAAVVLVVSAAAEWRRRDRRACAGCRQ